MRASWLFLVGLGCAVERAPEAKPQPKPEEPPLVVAPPVPEVALPALFLNELQARNESTVMRAPGEFPDWFELYNPGPDAVALRRVRVSSEGSAWRGDGQLEAGGYLRVWADEAEGGAPFKLNREGGELELTVDGVVVDRLSWSELEGDVSLARVPDGKQPQLSARPTPGWTNGSLAPGDDPSAALFQTERVLEMELWLSEPSVQALRSDPYTDVVGAFAFEGAFFPAVHVHLKGVWGSLRSIDAKCAFKVDLNDIGDFGLRGVKALTLNNMVQDASYVHEALSYELFRAMGVPAPRVGYTLLSVNGERYGLYLNVETVDDRMLARWFSSGDGPLWEGAYGVDLEPWRVQDLEYDGGPLPRDDGPVAALAEVLQRPVSAASEAEVERLVDMPRFLRMTAVEAYLHHWDGYYTSNNYRIYLDPDSGKLVFMPWGTDQTWVSGWFDLYGSNGVLARWCMASTGCRARYDQALRDTAVTAVAIDLEARLDELLALTRPMRGLDERGEHSLDDARWSVQATRQTIVNRPAEIDALVP